MEVIIMNTIKNQIRSAVIALTISSLLFAGSTQALDLNYASLKAKALKAFDTMKTRKKTSMFGIGVISLLAIGLIRVKKVRAERALEEQTRKKEQQKQFSRLVIET